MRSDEKGFTLVETMVSMLIFSIISTTFYMIMFSGNRASNTVRDVVRVSEEARLGLNRMIRDTREADEIAEASEFMFRVLINFDNDFDPITNEPIYTNDPVAGIYEDLTYIYDAEFSTIFLNGETLVTGVTPINDTTPVFSYTSNILEFDWDDDGVTTWQELDVAEFDHGVENVGDNSGGFEPTVGEWPYLSTVNFSFFVTVGDTSTEFHSRADLRNFLYAPSS